MDYNPKKEYKIRVEPEEGERMGHEKELKFCIERETTPARKRQMRSVSDYALNPSYDSNGCCQPDYQKISQDIESFAQKLEEQMRNSSPFHPRGSGSDSLDDKI